MLTDFILQITPVRLLNPLRKITEEDECGHRRSLQHRDILYLDELALIAWRGICGDIFRQHGIELGCGHGTLTVAVNFHSRFKHLEYTLLGQGTGKDDGEVRKWRKTLTDGILVMLYGCRALIPVSYTQLTLPTT